MKITTFASLFQNVVNIEVNEQQNTLKKYLSTHMSSNIKHLKDSNTCNMASIH